MKSFIRQMRVSKFVTKMNTNKRQRRSISYFRCYTVDEFDVKLAARRQQEKEALLKTTTPE